MHMHRYSEKEKEVLYNAVKELNNVFEVAPSVDAVCEFYIDLWDLYAKTSEEKVEYGGRGERDCVFARNVALRYINLAMMIDSAKNKDGYLLSSLLKTISDTMIAIIKLSEDGLEYQAFALLRTLFELFMTLIIVVGSPEKRESYKMARTRDEAYKVWRADFTKGRFITMLENYSGDYPDLLGPAKQWVTEAYGFLSSFAHNDSINVMLYTRPLFDKDGISPWSIWGEYVTRKDEIFCRLVDVVAPCDLLLFSMLNDPRVDVSMQNILCDEEDLPNTIRVYWTMDGLRKVCMLLLADHDSINQIKKEASKVNCPLFRDKTGSSI